MNFTECNCDYDFECEYCQTDLQRLEEKEIYAQEMLISYCKEYIPLAAEMRNEHRKMRWGLNIIYGVIAE